MLVYRSSFTVNQKLDAVVRAVRTEMIRWTERKHQRVLGRCGLDFLEAGTRLRADGLDVLMVDTRERSGSRIFGFVVEETGAGGTWHSQVMVAGGGRRRDAIVSILLDAPLAQERKGPAFVPKYVRAILDQVQADDHGVTLATSPTLIDDEAGVDRLIKELSESDHRGLVLVAGTRHDFPLGRWRDFIAALTAGTVGQSAAYVLTAEATDSFNARVSTRHTLLPGCLRTYLPGVRWAEERDGMRHRYLTPETLADDEQRRRASWILAERARQHTNSLPVDRETRRFEELLAVELDDIQFRRGAHRRRTVDAPETGSLKAQLTPVVAPAAAQAPAATLEAASEPADVPAPVAPPVAEPVALDEAMADPTRASEAVPGDLAALRARISELEAQASARERYWHDEVDTAQQLAEEAAKRAEEAIDAVQQEKRELNNQLTDLDIEQASVLEDKWKAEDRAAALDREVRVLRRLLDTRGLSDELWDAVARAQEDVPEPVTAPLGWDELATRCAGREAGAILPGLEFTCDWDKTRELDEQSTISTVAKTWDVLCALSDYARARGDAELDVRNLEHYLASPPSGYRTTSPGSFKPTESETVLSSKKLSAMRRFRVPEEVDPSGHRIMRRHVRLGQNGMVSPRLYFEDATSVAGYGKVIIGYIGPHLKNTQTN